MPTHKKKIIFAESEVGMNARKTLIAMVADSSFKTNASYSANTTLHPENEISFVDKHMEYLSSHPATDPEHYLSNLRLMTRAR